jgi:hypothetical protein
MSDKKYSVVCIPNPKIDSVYHVMVNETPDEYICICGMPNCRMKKMKSASDYMEKYKIHLDEDDFDIIEMNRYALCRYSNVCRWPITGEHYREPIINARLIKGYATTNDIAGCDLTNTAARLTDEYGITCELMASILKGFYSVKRDFMKTRFLHWRSDMDIYMSKLPSDILRIILEFSMFGYVME